MGEQGVSGAVLTAVPNPVPASGSEPGTTTVSWDTGDGSTGQVWVLFPDGREVLFAGGAKGTQEAPWIHAGQTYEFRLYRGEERALRLATIKVSGIS